MRVKYYENLIILYQYYINYIKNKNFEWKISLSKEKS